MRICVSVVAGECMVCGGRWTHERPHRHKVSVRVPIRRADNGADSFERVDVMVDMRNHYGAVDRAVQRVYGPHTEWRYTAAHSPLVSRVAGDVWARTRPWGPWVVIATHATAPVVEWSSVD